MLVLSFKRQISRSLLVADTHSNFFLMGVPLTGDFLLNRRVPNAVETNIAIATMAMVPVFFGENVVYAQVPVSASSATVPAIKRPIDT